MLTLKVEVTWPKGTLTLPKLERDIHRAAGARQRRVRRYLLTRLGPIRVPPVEDAEGRAVHLPPGPGHAPGLLAGLFKGLIGDPRVPRSSKALLLFGAAWIASPIHLIPEFIPGARPPR